MLEGCQLLADNDIIHYTNRLIYVGQKCG